MLNKFKALPSLLFISLAPLVTKADDPTVFRQCSGIQIHQKTRPHPSSSSILNFRFTIVNSSNCFLSGAVVTDYLPIGSSLHEVEPHPLLVLPDPFPVDKVKWKDVDLNSGTSSTEFSINLELSPTPGQIHTNTVCFEHPKTGRVCDEMDVTRP